MPSWPGARSAWAAASAELTRKAGPSPVVDGTPDPSQKRTANGRSGSARSISSRSGRAVGVERSSISAVILPECPADLLDGQPGGKAGEQLHPRGLGGEEAGWDDRGVAQVLLRSAVGVGG